MDLGQADRGSTAGPIGRWWNEAEKHQVLGRDRGSPVSRYEAPFEFTGRLSRVTVVMHDDQKLDDEGVGHAQMARQ